MLTVTICGGGAQGHVCAGVIASKGYRVNILTRRPQDWQSTLIVHDGDNRIEGPLHIISDSPMEVIPQAQIVLLCLPGYAIREELQRIRPWLSSDAAVGTVVSSTGFFFFAHEELDGSTRLFGLQRVPFIARTAVYGREVNLLGHKDRLCVAMEHLPDAIGFCSTLERMFSTPVSLMHSHYEVSLTNSNPILHTARLFTLWHDWAGQPTARCILFYKEWTVEAAQKLIDMDREFMQLLTLLPVREGAILSLLEYYESHDAESLCQKLQSISAFADIPAPMKQQEDGLWVPDFQSRYFTEDFPFGLRFIVELAHQHNLPVPCMEEVYEWGMSVAGR